MEERAVAAVVREYFDALRYQDVEAFLRLLAEGAEVDEPVRLEPARDPAAWRALYEELAGRVLRLDLRVEALFPRGREAAVHWVGYVLGKDHRTARLEGIHVFQLSEEGRVVSVRGYWDPRPLEELTATPASQAA